MPFFCGVLQPELLSLDTGKLYTMGGKVSVFFCNEVPYKVECTEGE